MDTPRIPRSADKHPPPDHRTCVACAGEGEYVSEVVFDYATGTLTQELTRCVSCSGAGTVLDGRLYLRTMAEVRAHRARIEEAQRKAADASRAVSLLADNPRASQERVERALERLDEAAAELRIMG